MTYVAGIDGSGDLMVQLGRASDGFGNKLELLLGSAVSAELVEERFVPIHGGSQSSMIISIVMACTHAV